MAKVFLNVKERLRVAMSKSEFISKVHEATNDDPWGPTGPQMDELVDLYPSSHGDIMREVERRINNAKRNWRQCYKSLLVLDHFIRNLDDQYLDDVRALTTTLRDLSNTFYYTDEKNVDRGVSVRERAKKILDVICDADVLADERRKAFQLKVKVAGGVSGGGAGDRRDEAPAQSKAAAMLDFVLRKKTAMTANPTNASFDEKSGLSPPRDRTKDTNSDAEKKRQQEESDYELALRLQREEELRANGGPSGETRQPVRAKPVVAVPAAVSAVPYSAPARTSAYSQSAQQRSPPPPVDPFAFLDEPKGAPQRTYSSTGPSSNMGGLDFFGPTVAAPTPAVATGTAPSNDEFDRFLSERRQEQQQQQSPPPVAGPPAPQADPFDFFVCAQKPSNAVSSNGTGTVAPTQVNTNNVSSPEQQQVANFTSPVKSSDVKPTKTLAEILAEQQKQQQQQPPSW